MQRILINQLQKTNMSIEKKKVGKRYTFTHKKKTACKLEEMLNLVITDKVQTTMKHDFLCLRQRIIRLRYTKSIL